MMMMMMRHSKYVRSFSFIQLCKIGFWPNNAFKNSNRQHSKFNSSVLIFSNVSSCTHESNSFLPHLPLIPDCLFCILANWHWHLIQKLLNIKS